MPFLLVNQAEVGQHDTKAAVGRAITDTHDTRAAVSNAVTDAHDTRAAVSNQRSNSFDTRAVVSNIVVDLFDTRAAISNLLEELFDTRAAVSNTGLADRFDTRAIVNPPTSFVHAAGGVYFPRAPRRPYRRGVQLHQLREYASGEEVYVYSKGGAGKVTHHLVFSHIDAGILAGLLSFVESTVKGGRETFTWEDHEQTSRTVRLSEPRVDHRKTGAGRYTIEIVLEEEL